MAHPVSPMAGGAGVSTQQVPPLEIGIATDPGLIPEKQVNEDSALARATRFGHLAVVCDGMGGHVGGKEASSLAIETIFRVLDTTPSGAPAAVLAEAIREANRAIFARGVASPELKGMGSTCVATLTHQGGTEVAHVGDSRVYLLTQHQVYQVTKDHSLVQRLVDANMLTPEEAPNHPSANQITNALGMKADVEVEVRPQPFAHTPGDTFILCSDGLSDEIGPIDMLQILAPFPTCDQAVRQMVDLANARGGHDNITVVAVRLAGGGPFQAPVASNHRTATPVIGLPTGLASATATMEMPTNLAVSLPIAQPSPHQQTQQLIHAHAPPGAFTAAPPGGPGAAPLPVFTPPSAFDAAPYSEPRGARRRSGGNGVLIAVIVVLSLALVGLGVAYFMARNATTASSPPPTKSVDDEPTESTSSKSSEPKAVVTKPLPTAEDAGALPKTKPTGTGTSLTPTAPTTTTLDPEPKPTAPPTTTATATTIPTDIKMPTLGGPSAGDQNAKTDSGLTR